LFKKMEEISEIQEIISEYKERSNKDLIRAMETLSDEFEKTKKTIINLTFYLENVEKTYDKLLKEYTIRVDGKL